MAIKPTPIMLKSPLMQEVYRSVDKVAPTNATVLISGETGVGKEIIAHRIHDISPRKKMPFNVVNCGALSENGLLMSELFGHEKGAFTDATSQRIGLFENTNFGTLFLDEVGDMPSEVQTKLLRVLESQEFTRLGGNKVINVDVRVITATNKCLKKALVDNEFRQDLYYRINRYPIHIPPLREHREDIPPLVDKFLLELSYEHQKDIKKITTDALAYLKNARLPGNIRELRNAIERAIISSQTDEIKIGDLPADIIMSHQFSLDSFADELREDEAIPSELHRILSQISVTEFILIFGEIPNAVWRELPVTIQQNVICEASFHLAKLLGGHQDAIRIKGKDRNQIFEEVARMRVDKYGSVSKAAESLGIDRRTLKTYLKEKNKEV